MSRWSASRKTEADDLKKIEISWLKSKGYFQGYVSGTSTWTYRYSGSTSSVGIVVDTTNGASYMRLYYSQTEDGGVKRDFDYQIPLTTSSCYFGGVRYWFICALSRDGNYCGKMVAVLYKNGDYFGCRHCYDLTYSSKNKNRRYKLSALFDTLDIYDKIGKLEETIKRPMYAGRVTKKQKKLDWLYRQVLSRHMAIKDLEAKKVIRCS